MKNKLVELDMVEYLRKNLSFGKLHSKVIKGIGDDAAVVKKDKNSSMLLTSDMLIEGKHFRKNDDLFEVGNKAINCSVSDIVAMGGIASYALVSLGLPRKFSKGKLSHLKLLYRGINNAVKKSGLVIVGGDTNSSHILVIDVAMIGFVSSKKMVLRDGAKAGDYLFVTGSLGGSIKGRHLNFIPRFKEAQFLVNKFKLNSMIDVSDGLLIDLWRIVKASNVGAVIFENCIPVHKDAKDINEALSMGEDFELLFSVSQQTGKKLNQLILSRKIPFPLSFIGKVIREKPKIWFIDKNNYLKLLTPKGFTHFK